VLFQLFRFPFILTMPQPRKTRIPHKETQRQGITETNQNADLLANRGERAVLCTTFNEGGLKSTFPCAYDSGTPPPLKRKSFGFYFCPAFNSLSEMFPLYRILLFYMALSTWRVFYNKFRDIFLFQDAYFTSTANKLYVFNSKHFSHRMTTCLVWQSTTVQPTHV
jgi:hypothetical protein